MDFSGSANRAVPSALSDHRQIDEARRAPRMEDPLRGLAVVAGFGKKNVRHVGLWVAVVEREPARLDLHHDAVARQKHMVHVRQCELVALHLTRRNGTGMDQTLAVTSAALIRHQPALPSPSEPYLPRTSWKSQSPVGTVNAAGMSGFMGGVCAAPIPAGSHAGSTIPDGPRTHAMHQFSFAHQARDGTQACHA